MPIRPLSRTRRATTVTREGRVDATVTDDAEQPARKPMPMPAKIRQAIVGGLLCAMACLFCLRNAVASGPGLSALTLTAEPAAVRRPLQQGEFWLGNLIYEIRKVAETGYLQLTLKTASVGNKPVPPPPLATPGKLEKDDISFILKTGRKVASRLNAVQTTWLTTVNRVVYVSDHEENIGGADMVRHTSAACDRALCPFLMRPCPPVQVDVMKPLFKLGLAEVDEFVMQNYVAGQSRLYERKSTDYRYDAYKFMGAFQESFRRCPQCKWHVLAEDDTFVFVSNLLHALQDVDHTKPYFFGTPSEFGCNAAESFRKGYYAEGGAGLIVSSAAIWQLISAHPGPVDTFRNLGCFHGDVKIAVQFMDAGVNLTTDHSISTNMHMHMPGSVSDSTAYPITFHYVKPALMQALFHITETVEPRRVPYGFIQHALSAAQVAIPDVTDTNSSHG